MDLIINVTKVSKACLQRFSAESESNGLTAIPLDFLSWDDLVSGLNYLYSSSVFFVKNLSTLTRSAE